MRSFSLVLLATLFSHQALAGSPFVKSVEQLMIDAQSTGDSSYMARASVRCTSLLMLISGIMTRDAPNNDFSSLDKAGESLYTLAIALELSKANERGASQDIQFAQDRISTELGNVSDLYKDWLNDNYARGGNYIESFPDTRSEYMTCMELGKMASQLGDS